MHLRRIVAVAAVGGLLNVVPAAAQARVPTFSKDVAPILYKNCVTCHRDGEIGPMPLLTYADARPWARSIRERVGAREMPPWFADPQYQTYRNVRGLSQKDIDTIVQWASNGAPQGNPADMPQRPDFTDGWQIGAPDLVIEMPAAFEVPETGTLPYKTFSVPTRFKRDMWVVAAEVRVEDRKHVHHAIVSVTEPRAGRPTGAVQVKMLPPEGSDWPSSIEGQKRMKAGVGVMAATERRLASYATGEQPAVFPEGYARRVPAGSILNFWIHYATAGEAGTDRTKLGLIFAKDPPKAEIVSGLVNNSIFEIPPGAADAAVESEGLFLKDVKIWAFHPQMFARGKDVTYTAIYPDGRREVLLKVSRFRQRWQLDYHLVEPKALPKGSKLVVTAHFDNSSANRLNPDPKAVVHFGEQLSDEVMSGYFDYTIEPPARPTSAAR